MRRGTVRVTSTGDGKEQRHLAECSACGWAYANNIKSDVQWQAQCHRSVCKGAP